MARKPRYKFLRMFSKKRGGLNSPWEKIARFKDTTYKKPKREKGGWQVFNPDEGTKSALPQFRYNKKK